MNEEGVECEWQRRTSSLGKGGEMVDFVPKRRGNAESCGHDSVEFSEIEQQNIKRAGRVGCKIQVRVFITCSHA